ncbi:MAG: McrC family protein [Blastocatellia bacterium]|nr:McrC family protein [Blastocatellia bacterium]
MTRSGRLEVLELAGGLELRATSYVGRVQLGALTLTIQPKLQGAPLLNLLRYAYGLRHLDLFNPIGFVATEWSFQELLIHQLAAEVDELLIRGLHRNYVRINEELASPKGRIDFNRYMQSGPNGKATLPCIHSPRVDDTPLNQAVLAGLKLAKEQTADIDLKAHLNHLVKIVGATVSLKRIDLFLLERALQVMDRRTTAYQAALTLIRLLLGEEGIRLDGESDQVQVPGFLFDMNRFFQALLSRFLHDYLPGYQVEDEKSLNHMFRYDPKRNPRQRKAPLQRPDFIISGQGKIVAVLDAKYRDLWEKSLPREMLYQLALYALGRPQPCRQAVILYPTVSALAREQAILIHQPGFNLVEGEVILRPVNLLELERLIQENDFKANDRRKAFAAHLVFGQRSSALQSN